MQKLYISEMRLYVKMRFCVFLSRSNFCFSNVFENEKDDSLFVLNAKVSYSGLYTCLAKNDVGTAEATSKITIQRESLFD